MARAGSWEVVSELRAEIPRTFEFSAMELAVLRMLATGRSNREINRTLRLDNGELRVVYKTLEQRLGVSGRRRLIWSAQDIALSEL